jgi:hypothetical protein
MLSKITQTLKDKYCIFFSYAESVFFLNKSYIILSPPLYLIIPEDGASPAEPPRAVDLCLLLKVTTVNLRHFWSLGPWPPEVGA